MIKKEIYPKTKRLKIKNEVVITEKLDGSNLTFFKKNDELYIAQRKTIFTHSELEEVKGILYKGLYAWLKENGKYLEENLNNNSAICGEWLGMGKIKYDELEFPKKWYMFAKANIDDDFNLTRLNYYHDTFIYPFINQEIPKFIGTVPIARITSDKVDKEYLDKFYEECSSSSARNIEGFVINRNNDIEKYVRFKDGKLVDHFERGE